MIKRVFAVAAHPDDIEFVMAGTLIRLRDAGYELHYMNVANGCCGSTEHDAATTAHIRRQEAIDACRSIGAVFHESLTNDLDIFYDRPTLARLAAIMREVTPEVVLTHSPVDYMEDHTNTCRLAVTAAFARCMPNFATEPPRAAIGQSVTVYHAQPHGNQTPLGEPAVPSLFVDVTDVMPQKTAMLACHTSQKRWLDESQGLDSYLHTMQELSAEVGRMSGRFQYAEGWRRHLHLGFCDAAADPLTQAIRMYCLNREV
ncbi:MAG TPA: PIG-L deacetylase family protein [Pirellulales bacterium]|jgi:LmbE family N-acetylglucosaminyl deacetylase|nr:PIG-L deacetylase family protein [Pirellulales bacterium]